MAPQGSAGLIWAPHGSAGADPSMRAITSTLSSSRASSFSFTLPAKGWYQASFFSCDGQRRRRIM
eukprot:3464250-Pyramimonas_sp.AAC.1